MSVETEITKMTSVYLFLNLFFLTVHQGVDAAFFGEKPMIYINLFDEIVVDNTTTKLNDREIPPSVTTINLNSVKDVRNKLDLSTDLLKPNGENKSSVPSPYDSLFEFEKPSKADITEVSIKESDIDTSTVGRLPDLIDPEMLEPELNRIFFIKAIANLIEHIMEAIFSLDETSKLNESSSLEYDSSPSRKVKKRDLPAESSIKPSDIDFTSNKVSSFEHSIGSKTDSPSGDVTSLKDFPSNADLIRGKKNAESPVSNLSPEKLIPNEEHLKTEPKESSQNSSTTLVSRHISPHHVVHKSKNHNNTEGHDEKSQHQAEVHQEGNVLEQKKHIPQANLSNEATVISEEIADIIHLSKENSAQNDDFVSKNDAHSYGGTHKYTMMADEHDGYKFDDLVDDEEEDYASDLKESSSLVTILLVSTTVMILMILVAFGVAAAYLFQKNQAQSGNQNASNLHAAVA